MHVWSNSMQEEEEEQVRALKRCGAGRIQQERLNEQLYQEGHRTSAASSRSAGSRRGGSCASTHALDVEAIREAMLAAHFANSYEAMAMAAGEAMTLAAFLEAKLRAAEEAAVKAAREGAAKLAATEEEKQAALRTAETFRTAEAKLRADEAAASKAAAEATAKLAAAEAEKQAALRIMSEVVAAKEAAVKAAEEAAAKLAACEEHTRRERCGHAAEDALLSRLEEIEADHGTRGSRKRLWQEVGGSVQTLKGQLTRARQRRRQAILADGEDSEDAESSFSAVESVD